jgi:hypothetical protein
MRSVGPFLDTLLPKHGGVVVRTLLHIQQVSDDYFDVKTGFILSSYFFIFLSIP